MKKYIKVLLFALLISAGITNSIETKAQTANVSFSVFYNSLKPYGRWMNNPTYGQVWVSNVQGFSPYSTGGYWAYTDYGWTWVSNYNWGWAPFHYGRWAYDPAYGGWFWVPGYEWGPAWVAWRNSNDYYGWAPLSPGLSISIGISSYNSIPTNIWVFAPVRYISSPSISRYYVPRTKNVTIINHTTVVNNVTVKNNVHYVSGPQREDVEKVNHQKIKTYTVANSSKPGKTVVNNNTVNVYRPVVNSDNKTVINSKSSNNSNTTTTVNSKPGNKTVTTDKQPSSDAVKAKPVPQQQIDQQKAQQSEQQKQQAQQKTRQQQLEQQQKAQQSEQQKMQAQQKLNQQQLEQQKQAAQQKAREQVQQKMQQQQAAQQRAQQQAAQQKAQQQKQQQEVVKKKTPVDNRNNDNKR